MTDPDARLRRVLVFAYYFPPMGLSGVQRVAKLVKYLPRWGWQPVVVTPRPAGYFAFDDELATEVEAAGADVRRTPSVDPTRLFGRKATVALPQEPRRRRLARLSGLLFVPDNKLGWGPFAVREGLRAAREEPVEAVLSSAPPYTSHLAAAFVARRLGVPLVLDYRDDWTDNPRHEYPTGLHRRLSLRLERSVLRQASAVTAINAPIARAIDERAGEPLATVLPQGYDPEDLAGIDGESTDGRFRLVYTGVFYDAQTPDVFLRGLRRFLDRMPEAQSDTRAHFVGLFPEASRELVATLALDDTVVVDGYRPHRESVRMLGMASVLWMTIGDRPGAEGISTSKLFEYIGTRRPILALVPDGAARDALAPYGAAHIVHPDDEVGVAEALAALYLAWRAGDLPRGDRAYAERFDRVHLAGRMAALLDGA